MNKWKFYTDEIMTHMREWLYLMKNCNSLSEWLLHWKILQKLFIWQLISYTAIWKFRSTYFYTFFLTIIYVWVAYICINVYMCFYRLCTLPFMMIWHTAHIEMHEKKKTKHNVDTLWHTFLQVRCSWRTGEEGKCKIPEWVRYAPAHK